jgi:[acyl-carrier-protein] S-malonyltransferase
MFEHSRVHKQIVGNQIMTIAAVFPGQGAQSVGMLGELADHHPSILDTFAEASSVLGFDLWALVQNGRSEELAETENTQPALLTSSVALWRVWQSGSIERDPAFVAGHSLGEYSALVCADALKFDEGVALVRKRGELMQEAVPSGQGTMAAILGLENEQIDECCLAVDGVVGAANYNAPGQVVIAGETPAVEAAMQACKDAGAKRALRLNVSGPFHSELMGRARDQFAAELAAVNVQMPRIPIVQNVNASSPGNAEELIQALIDQLSNPVLWTGCVETMLANGVDQFVECGPGNVLAGLAKRISRDSSTTALSTKAGMDAAIAS